jgi:hypothetical protein
MTRPYLVFRNDLLYTRVLTFAKARKIALSLQAQGFRASYAEEIQGGEN